MLLAVSIVIGIWWVVSSAYVAYKGTRRPPGSAIPNYRSPSSQLSDGVQLALFIGIIVLAPIFLAILGLGYLASKQR